MSDAKYILGTVEYVIWEVECTTPGFTFTPSEWTAVAALTPIGESFVDGAATWASATLETVGTKHYAKALLSDLLVPPAAGKYRGFVRVTKTLGGAEVPLLKGLGLVIVEDG